MFTSQYVPRDIYCDDTDVPTRVERLMSDARSVCRCPRGHSAGECGPKVHGIISGLEGLIAGIKNGGGRLNR